MTLRLFLASIVLAASCINATNAQAAIKHTIDIRAQGLGPALADLARQTGIQLIYPADLVAGVSAQTLSGSMTPEEALRQLLSQTKLQFEFLDARTVTLFVHRTSGSAQPGVAINGTAETSKNVGEVSRALRVAQATETDLGSTTSANTRKQGDRTEPRELPAPEEVGKGIPEILVKGSKIINADIQRTEDDPQPYVVFDRDQIERSMSSNLEDFLNSRLPMNTVQMSNSQNVGGAFGSQSSINLRGLGTNQTLILVNGRRLPSVSAIAFGGRFNQPDINGIPLAAVERIEVLPSTAGGIYGGGATGGVVNIIMKTDYTGMDVKATYENTFDTDAAQRRLEASAGFGLEDGKTNILVSASFADSNPLLAGDREFNERSRALLLANNPDAIFDSSDPPIGFTSNMRSTDGSNLVLDNGTALGSPIAFVPEGYAGTGTDGGAALVANAGRYNLEQPDDLSSVGLRQSLLNAPVTKSAALSVRRSLGSRTEAFVDAAWTQNNGEVFAAGLFSTTYLPADAPNNPFTTDISVTYPATGIVFRNPSLAETLRTAGGVIVRLPHDWAAHAEYGWSRSRFETSSTNLLSNSGVYQALQDGSIDVMRDLNAFPLDFSGYPIASPSSVYGPFDTTLTNMALRVSGPLLRLSGGPLMLTTLLEHRKESAADGFADSLTVSAGTPVSFVSYYPHRAQSVDSGYIEIRAPLFSAANSRPGLREFELQASVRRDEYETTSVRNVAVAVPSRSDPLPPVTYSTGEVQSTDFTLGLRYSPVRDVALRASYGTGFLPPSIDQIASRTNNATVTLIDPRRGGNAYRYSFSRTSSGNPDLESEESESWSAGMILTPRWVPGMRLSLDYTRIEKIDEIASLSDQDIINLEDAFPGRVVRGPANPADPPGYAGPIIAVNSSLLNLARTKVEAYDIQADYRWNSERLGTFEFFALATLEPRFERQVLTTAPIVDPVGFADGPLKWRGNAGFSWERESWTLGWNARYYDDYLIYSSVADDSSIAMAVLSQGGATIPSQVYHDAFARYRVTPSAGIAGGLFSNAEIMFGIRNLFDKSPPIIASSAGDYSTYGDPRLRYYSISVRTGF